MDKFGSVELKLTKDIKMGDKENLLSLFDVDERFKPIEVLKDAEDESTVKVVLEGLGEADLNWERICGKGKRKLL